MKPPTHPVKKINYNHEGAIVTLTERNSQNAEIESIEILKLLREAGYTDDSGNILPHLFLDSLEIVTKGQGTGRIVMEEIKQIAKEKYSGRLLLIPSYNRRNPSPFYYKCGLRSTTREGEAELKAYFEKGTPFHSGSSTPMYLPIK